MSGVKHYYVGVTYIIMRIVGFACVQQVSPIVDAGGTFDFTPLK